MRSRPISVFTIYHSDNAKTEISSRLLEIMQKVNCCLWADTPALAFFFIYLAHLFSHQGQGHFHFTSNLQPPSELQIGYFFIFFFLP